MKKLFPIAILAILSISFTSCKKDYTCTCYFEVASGNYTQKTTYPNTTKSKAKDGCKEEETTANAIKGGLIKTTCSVL